MATLTRSMSHFVSITAATVVTRGMMPLGCASSSSARLNESLSLETTCPSISPSPSPSASASCVRGDTWTGTRGYSVGLLLSSSAGFSSILVLFLVFDGAGCSDKLAVLVGCPDDDDDDDEEEEDDEDEDEEAGFESGTASSSVSFNLARLALDVLVFVV